MASEGPEAWAARRVAPKTTLCRPKALRLVSIAALGRSSRRIFVQAWCADGHDGYFENDSRQIAAIAGRVRQHTHVSAALLLRARSAQELQ